MNTSHDCKEELKEASLKATPARLAVLRLLEKIGKPIDVSIIKEYFEQKNLSVDQATIFRIMNIFTDRGLTKQIDLHEGKYRYELSSGNDHHHLICEECGAIEDISDCNISELEKDIQKKKQFLVKRHSLEFFGICKQCQK